MIDLVSLKIQGSVVLLGIMAWIDPKSAVLCLTALSTGLSIIYHAIKIRQELKKKSDGSNQGNF